jgi:hypothetical protein
MPFLNPISAHGIDFGNIEVVVARSFDLGGRQLQPGEVVPDGALPPRRLRQMFERRMITIRAVSIGPNVPPAPEDAEAPPAAENGGVAAEIAAPATTAAEGARRGRQRPGNRGAGSGSPTPARPATASNTAASAAGMSSAPMAPRSAARTSAP